MRMFCRFYRFLPRSLRDRRKLIPQNYYGFITHFIMFLILFGVIVCVLCGGCSSYVFVRVVRQHLPHVPLRRLRPRDRENMAAPIFVDAAVQRFHEAAAAEPPLVWRLVSAHVSLLVAEFALVLARYDGPQCI